MLLELNSFNNASTVFHAAQGCALLTLACAEIYAAYRPAGVILFAAPAALILSALVTGLAGLYFLGGWGVDAAILALRIKPGFHIFISFACLYVSAGMAQLMYLSSSGKAKGWHYLFLFFLAFIAGLYLIISRTVAPAAAREVAVYHAGMAFALFSAVLFKLAYHFLDRRTLNFAWAIMLFISAFQLLSYREIQGAFDFRMVSVTSGSGRESQAAEAGNSEKNVKTAPQKRAGN